LTALFCSQQQLKHVITSNNKEMRNLNAPWLHHHQQDANPVNNRQLRALWHKHTYIDVSSMESDDGSVEWDLENEVQAQFNPMRVLFENKKFFFVGDDSSSSSDSSISRPKRVVRKKGKYMGMAGV
jgi:hypothetical protein